MSTFFTPLLSRLKRLFIEKPQQLGTLLRTRFFGAAHPSQQLEALEKTLLMADVGVHTTKKIVTRCRHHPELNETNADKILFSVLQDLLQQVEAPLIISEKKPFVMLVVGVNGVGKTTMIGKLAHHFHAHQRVLLAAGDTFRAGAINQLRHWSEQIPVELIAQHPGADPAAVTFDAMHAAQARQSDLLIIDTAGRLQKEGGLQAALKKMVRVIQKVDPTAPHEVLLVLDATLGQNAHSQCHWFNEAVTVTGLAITKLDGSAKGGVIFGIADRAPRPIRFISYGETLQDIGVFESAAFMEGLFSKS